MKTKIVGLVLALTLVCVGAIGGTLAYFTAQDKADNVFTFGNIKIKLLEDFDKSNSQLLPKKDIQKEVNVKNTGKNDAYVRLLIAIPSAVNDGDPNQNAEKNFVHFNFTSASHATGLWSWKDKMTDGEGYISGMKDWNFIGNQTIDEVNYDVYIVTYRTVLKKGETTKFPAMNKVYLDEEVNCIDNGDGTITYIDENDQKVTMKNNETLQIKVYAQAVQADTFKDPYAAFSKAEEKGNITSKPWVK